MWAMLHRLQKAIIRAGLFINTIIQEVFFLYIAEFERGLKTVKKSTGIQVALLSLVPFIMVLGNSMLIPVLPRIKESLRISQFWVSLLITAFSIPAGLVIPLAGMLSDQIGRKKVMAPALPG